MILMFIFQALKVSDHYPVEVELKSMTSTSQETDGNRRRTSTGSYGALRLLLMLIVLFVFPVFLAKVLTKK